MLELATMGAGVLHPRCVEVERIFGTRIHVRSSFNHNEGTIVDDGAVAPWNNRWPSAAWLFDRNVAKVSIFDVPDKPGTAAHIFDTLANEHVNVDMIIQAGQRKNRNKISLR